MAISKNNVTLDGQIYTLDDRDRVAAQVALQSSTAGAHFKYTATSTEAPTDIIIGKLGSDDQTANPYVQGTTKLFPLGTKLIYGDREFVYVFMNGACTAGKLLQQAPHVAHHINMTVTNADATSAYSHAIGSTTLSVETNGTNLVKNEFADGYMLVNDVTGEGQLLKIKSHPAHVHGTDPSVVFTTYDPLTTAIVKNSSQLSAHHNPYNHVVTAPVTETGAVIGATVIDMTDNYYGWAVTSGPAAALVSGADIVLGENVMR